MSLFTSIDLPFTYVVSLAVEKETAALITSSPDFPLSVVLLDLNTLKTQTIKSSREDPIDPAYISFPQPLAYPSTEGRIAHAFYYPPKNPLFTPLPGEKPPLLVRVHGGPTGHSPPAFNPGFLFWTSRGFGVLDVNYGGSSGYGRKYRDLLKGNWGIVDVDDCIHGAQYCVEKGFADPKRLAIEGGSAGGYTTLAALTFHKVFQVGADHYGVSDLAGCATDTHKFESHYFDLLVGPYPEAKEIYDARSPLQHAEQISCPVIIFQGSEDAVVPPSQSEKMYKCLMKKKIPAVYILYPGEQHGFRKAENIKKTFESQLDFFSKILGFSLSNPIDPASFDK